MRSSTHIVQPLLPLEAIKLGRFITSTDQPHQGYKDPAALDASDSQLVTHQHNLEQRTRDGHKSAIKVDSTSVAAFSTTKSEGHTQGLSTRSAVIYQLDNSDAWFDQAIQDQDVRRWIQRAITSTGKIYLVVGYKTIVDAAFGQQRSKADGWTASATIPVTEVAVAATSALPVSLSVGDPGFERSKLNESHARQVFEAPGEQVTEIQVRRVKFKFLSSKDLDQAKLDGKARWKNDWQMRGVEAGTNDVVEARLQESDDPDSDTSDEDL